MKLSIDTNNIKHIHKLDYHFYKNITKFVIKNETQPYVECEFCEHMDTIYEMIENMTDVEVIKIYHSCMKENKRPFKSYIPTSVKEFELYENFVDDYNEDLFINLKQLLNLSKLTLKLSYHYDKIFPLPELTNLTYLKLEIAPVAEIKSLYELYNLETLIIDASDYIPNCELYRKRKKLSGELEKLEPHMSTKYSCLKITRLYSALVAKVNACSLWRFNIEKEIFNFRRLRVMKLLNLCVGYVHKNVRELDYLTELVVRNDCDEIPIVPELIE